MRRRSTRRSSPGGLLVNLDGTSDGALTIGCAGSDHTFLRVPLGAEPVPPDHVVLRIELSGAKGGHSGGDIAAGRANAIKALGRVLAATPVRLAAFGGGVSRNAIPRDASATVAVSKSDETGFRAAAEAELEAIVREFAGTDDAARALVHFEVRRKPPPASTRRAERSTSCRQSRPASWR